MLLAINIVFVAMGLFVLPHNRDVGIVTLAFFGSCLAVSAAVVARKLRYRKFSAEKVDVIGGVPIRPQKTLMIVMGLWLMALGIILLIFAHDAPVTIQLLSGFMAVIGALLFAGALLGRWPGGYLQFDPAYFTIAQRKWRVRIPWDSITGIYEGEYHSKPVLLLRVDELSTLTFEPPEVSAQAFTAIAKMQTYMGAEFAVMTMHYGIDLPVLAATVTRYVNDAPARIELGQRLL